MKKIISIVSAIAMMASMAFTVSAEAPVTVTFNYDADASAAAGELKAIINVDVASTVDLDSATINFSLVDGDGNNVTSEYVSKAAYEAKIAEDDNGTCMYNKNGGNIMLAMCASTDLWVLNEDGPEAVITLTLSKEFDKAITFSFDEGNAFENTWDGYIYEATTGDLVQQVGTAIPGPSTGGSKDAVQVKDADNNDIFTDAANAQAVAYYVELDSTASTKTGKWYATFTDAEGNAVAKKTNADVTVPNIEGSGKARLGLIYKGTESVSAVSFKWN